MLEENKTQQQTMQNQIQQGKSILDNPQITREEMLLKPEPAKKSKIWIFKLILIILVIILVFYIFANLQIIQNFVNNFFSNLLK